MSEETHETYLTRLWLDNDELHYARLTAKAEEILREHWDDNKAELATGELPIDMTKAMEEELDAVIQEIDNSLEIPDHGLMRDLLNHSLRQVDTWEIAKQYMICALDEHKAELSDTE